MLDVHVRSAHLRQMYPIFRLAKHFFIHRNAAPLKLGETHVARVTCMPWDIDVFMEMNNGRVLTLLDLGRFLLFHRMGVTPHMKTNGWYGTIAGTAIRYRRRITLFQRLEMHTRVIGWDDRFTYVEQSLWRGNDCCAHAVLRTALTTGKGIVPPSEIAAVLDMPDESPPLPGWVQAWSDAEADRPWPPMQDSEALQAAA